MLRPSCVSGYVGTERWVSQDIQRCSAPRKGTKKGLFYLHHTSVYLVPCHSFPRNV